MIFNTSQQYNKCFAPDNSSIILVWDIIFLIILKCFFCNYLKKN